MTLRPDHRRAAGFVCGAAMCAVLASFSAVAQAPNAAQVVQVDTTVIAVLPVRGSVGVPTSILDDVTEQVSVALTTTSYAVVEAVDVDDCGHACMRDIAIRSNAGLVLDVSVTEAHNGYGITMNVYDAPSEMMRTPYRSTFGDAEGGRAAAVRVGVHRLFGTTAVEGQALDIKALMGGTALIGAACAVGAGGSAAFFASQGLEGAEARDLSLFATAAGALSFLVCGAAWFALPDASDQTSPVIR